MGEKFLKSKKEELNEEILFKKFYKYIEGKEVEDKLFEVYKNCLKELSENIEKEVKTWQ